MNKFSPMPHNLVTLLLATLLAGSIALGCKKAEEPPPLSSPAPANSGVASTNPTLSSPPLASPGLLTKIPSRLAGAETDAPLSASNSPAARIERLIQPFQSAPPETRARIEDALATFKAGQTKAAIAKLKMVDADSPITAEQQTAILNLILEMRK